MKTSNQHHKTRWALVSSALFTLFIGLNLTTTTGCYYDNEEELYPGATCDTTNITYTAHISSIMSNSCATIGCHVAGGSGPGIFDNYAGVMDKVDDGSFFDRTIVDLDMPPSGPLSACQLEIITAWIDAGSPE